MKKAAQRVAAAEANRRFSELLRGVRRGKRFVVTSHGKAVAKIEPVEDDKSRSRAKKVLLDRLQTQPVIHIGPWTRDELYEK